MLLEQEDAAVVKPDALEDAVAIEQAVIEHGNLGVGLIDELAVEIDFEVLHQFSSLPWPAGGGKRRTWKSACGRR